MGYDLCSNGKSFRANIFIFPKLLRLAFLFGWEPRGTELLGKWDGENDRDNSAWGGHYLSNSYQTVIKEDAKEIAVSLQKALQYIPDTDFVLKESILLPKEISIEESKDDDCDPKHKTLNQITEGEEVGQFLSEFGDILNTLRKKQWYPKIGDKAFGQITEKEKDQLLSEFISHKDYLKEFIDFCGNGEFCIS